MFDNITIGTIVGISVSVLAIERLFNLVVGWLNTPAQKLEKTMDDRLIQIEHDNAMMLEVVFSLLEHEVTNDHVTDMQELYGRVKSYIINKK